MGLNAGTQWFTLAGDFTSTRLVIQAVGSKHGIDLAGHTLTLKGSMRSYNDDNGFTVSNGTLSIVNEYRVGSEQSGKSDPTKDYLIVTGPNTTFSAANLYLCCGTNNFCTVQDGATVNAKLVFGDATSRIEGNVLRVTGLNTRFVNTVSDLNLFYSDANCRNLLEVSGGAKFEGMSNLYFKGIENHVRFADNALPATPDTLSIIGGTSNVLEVAGSTFGTAGTRLNITAGSGHRISLQDGTRYYFPAAYTVFGGGVTDSILEITGGSVFARTNENVKTSTSGSETAANNTIRIADAGSKLLFDGYVYVGESDKGATMLIEDGGMLEHSGRNSGSVYVSQKQTSGNALVVRGVGSKVAAGTLNLAANGASNCRVEVSDHGVVSNSSSMSVSYWKRDPSDSEFSSAPGGTNVLAIFSDGRVNSPSLSLSGVGNVIAVTNGELVLTSTMLMVPDRRYALAIPDPIFETEAALAKLKTIPRDMHVRIGGSRSVIKTTNTDNGNIYFAKNTDFSFEIPEAGYEQVPIQSAKNIEIVGCGKITIDAAHPKDKVILMQAAGSISIDDASLAAFNSALPPNYKVKLSRDGKQLLLVPQFGLFIVIQ